MRFRIGLTLTFLLIATQALAVAPQFWRVRSAEEFLAGEIEGFAVTSRGELKPAPGLTKVASFTDPFVLSQVTAPNGDRFFGTGNDGKVYRLRGTELKLLFTASEPEIYAINFHDGALYAGSSPNGKVYRVDPGDGKSSVFYDPKQAYIWALEFAGDDLLVATGVEGKLFRVRNGQGKELFDGPETHIRAVAVRKDGTILAGGSGKGRIYEVRADGSAHALYDSSLNEISSIYIDANGTGWAAGVSDVRPAAAPARQQQKQGSQQGQGSGSSQSGGSSDQQKQDQSAAATVDVSFSFEDSSANVSQAGSGELYRINSDGFVEIVRKFEREMIYGISGGRSGAIVLATGPQGRVYEYRDGEVALIATVPDKQIVSISTTNGATLVTTTNSGAVYRLDSTPSTKAEFRSAAKDVERFSKFGHYRIDGDKVANGALAIAFRSGNTRTPDDTWSDWTAPAAASEGNIGAPAGRYIQWKLTAPKPANDVIVDGVTVAFINRNVAPQIESVAVQEPAVVFISSAYPSSPQVVEATNPDEYGIFTSLDNPRDRSEQQQQGKRVFRKGFRTITWRARDDNGDTLRYTVSFRQKGTERWLRLRDNVDETQVNFDTSQLPDGRYELRLVASDITDNPEQPLSDTKEGVEFMVDNTPPAVTSRPNGKDVEIRISDKLSTVGKVEYSADAQKWIRLTPADGIADSGEETYTLERGTVDGKFVIVRAVDGFYNVATESVSVR